MERRVRVRVEPTPQPKAKVVALPPKPACEDSRVSARYTILVPGLRLGWKWERKRTKSWVGKSRGLGTAPPHEVECVVCGVGNECGVLCDECG